MTIPFDKVRALISFDLHILASIVYAVGFIFYKLFLKKISTKRHLSLQDRFKRTLQFLISSSVLSLIDLFFYSQSLFDYKNTTWAPYFVFAALIFAIITLVKIIQIVIYLYLFLANMSQGVPRLIANMLTCFISLVLVHLVASQLFEIQLSALLTTSAVFSLVLGLALQDTLGNLFSGLSLQIESPFKIDDWIEVHSKDKKWLGQVQEINWRATFLNSFSEELIMIPNKTIAQSEIIIISQGNKNIRLSQTFRFDYAVDIEKAKAAISTGFSKVPGLMTYPPLRILITETNESYLTMKAFYSLVDFSLKYRIGDEILSAVISQLNSQNIKLQTTKLEILK